MQLAKVSTLAGPPPVLTVQPTNQTVLIGGTATFVVQATSGTTLSYQWYFQATLIPGATNNTFLRPNAQLPNAGPYYVAVKNADGTVNSTNAVLTVINNAPNLSGANDLTSIIEDPSANPGTLVSALIAGKISDADVGALNGIAVTAVDNLNGNWQYTTNGGAAWVSFGTPSPASARLLAADANTLVRFVPNPNWNGTVVNGITFQAWDRTSGSAGSTGVLSTNHVRDSFSTTSYGNNNGTVSWVGSWVETDSAGGGASTGEIRITNGDLRVHAALNGDSIYRDVNLTNQSAATITIDYSNGLGNGDRVDLQLSVDGGSNYTSLLIFTSSSNPGAEVKTIDISPYAGGSLRVRFIVVARSANQNLLIDDLKIAYSTNLVGGNTAFSTGSASASIVVNAVNDAPMLDNAKSPALSTINANAGAPSGAVGTLVSALVDFANPSGQVDNVTDPDSGALLGIAIEGADSANGSVWYSTNNGASWTTLGAVASTAARLLAADANTRLYFQPNPSYFGTLTNAITFRAWDRTAGTAGGTANVTTNGGVTAFSASSDTVSITVVPLADVVTIQSGPTSIAAFTDLTYTVTVSNQGPSAASNVVVTDTLASKFKFVSASAGGSYLGGVVTWPTLASLASGATMNFMVTVTSPNKGLLTNIVASTCATADPSSANNNGSTAAAQAITAVTSIKVANTSSGASVSTLNWSHTVAAGSARILIVGISIDSPSTTVIAATFANFLPLTAIGQTNGTQTKVAMYYLLNPPVGTFPIAINLSAPTGIVGGAVSLNGVDQANPVMTFSGKTGTGNPSLALASTLGGIVIDTLAPKSPQQAVSAGGAQTIVWNQSASNYSGAGSSLPGDASVALSWILNGTPAWAMAAVALNPATVLADIAVTATGPTNVVATSNLTYSITVTNLGLDAATNVVVSDALPTGAIFVSASSGGTLSGGIVTWPTLTNFPNGETTNYTVTITVPSSGMLTNIACSTAPTADPDPSNNNGTGNGNQVITTVTPRADVATTVTGPTSVLAAANFSYSITLTNAGPSPAINVLLSDALPVGATFLSASSGGTNDAGVVTWPPVATLDSGAATNFTVTLTAPAIGSLSNTVSSSALTGDPDLSNNNGSAPAAQVITTVTPVADVQTTVTGPVGVLAMANFSYTITLTNAGPSSANNLVVRDTLPAGTTFLGATGGGNHNAGIITWPGLASLASGAVTNLAVTVTAPASGRLTNTVSSSADTIDLDLPNNDGSAAEAKAVTTIYAPPSLNGQQLPDGTFQLGFITLPEILVSIQTSTNLVDWQTFLTTNSGSGAVGFIDREATNYPIRFYRSLQAP